jgi:DNA polymerase III subunit chi
VPEVLFYHLTASPLERNLPEMLEKSLSRGWRVLLRCGSEGAVAGVDTMLWTWREEGFLPHGTGASPWPERQPVYITVGMENPNDSNVLMLVEGARARPEDWAGFERTCLIFDGADAGAVAAAREDWLTVKALGIPAKYWAQDGGRWVQKAAG